MRMRSAEAPAIWMVLKRARGPAATRRRETGRSRALASRRRQASLARHLGTTDVNLSRWETGDIPVNPAADRLLRVLYTLHTVKAERVVEPAKFIQAFLETFAKIAPSKHPKPLPLEIPA